MRPCQSSCSTAAFTLLQRCKNVVQYCFIPTLVSAKLSAFKYFYLFVWDSINIYEHIVTVLYILSSFKAMYAVNVLVFRMTNNKI